MWAPICGCPHLMNRVRLLPPTSWDHRHIDLPLTCLHRLVSFLSWLLLRHRNIFQEERCHQGSDTEEENSYEPMLEGYSQQKPEQLEHLAEQVQYLLRSLRSY